MDISSGLKRALTSGWVGDTCGPFLGPRCQSAGLWVSGADNLVIVSIIHHAGEPDFI